MHILLIACHPREDSYNAALRQAVQAALEGQGHEIRLRDLYAEGFRPALSAAEHRVTNEPGRNRAGIEREVEDLRWAEALILIYPTWWYGMPAMLKGWFDRVWLPGVAFRIGPGAIEPLLTRIRRIAVVTTYGSPVWLLWYLGWPDRRVVGRGLRRLCARGCRLDWHCLTDMDRREPWELDRFLVRIRQAFAAW
ncbi:NAD(P)H-dependent oxidoreductase [Roseicella frigidaeris]|uniref:Flavodoxin family protein n=1 Tax=Roseicella frigidaeris TaxID=2230885 RepID=A0A327M9B9_9PROT|nr:NAD(P)H-dependent oxidoreductase [Roseicella frigidaeris]RAI58996.1 flavodoxin family protein [Roseicella frigidaeris]